MKKESAQSLLPLDELTAISSIDGRYREQVAPLVEYSSEFALIRTRVEVEARYLIALSEAGLVRVLTPAEQDQLLRMGPQLTLEQGHRVKEIEAVTRHDVKAMERTMRELVAGTSLEDVTEMIHFALTSEDINNLSYRLMLKRALHDVIVPSLDKIVDHLIARASEYRDIPMPARTHGQPAVPTAIGKELANFAIRLHKQVGKLQSVQLTGKLNGAVGNFNAHTFSSPDIDWITFSKDFVQTLGLEPNLFTTQINTAEDMIEVFQALQRVNGVLLDLDQDMWRYISDDWFVQQIKEGEVGSSTMPQKVNPILFENAEANLQDASNTLEGMGRKLGQSRLQRDLSDSSTHRNTGRALAHGLLAYGNTLTGLERVRANVPVIEDQLTKNWSILSEAAQTLLRRAGQADPYTAVASLAKGKTIKADDWKRWVSELDAPPEIKEKLSGLTPAGYVGLAPKLTDMAIQEIDRERQVNRLRQRIASMPQERFVIHTP